MRRFDFLRLRLIGGALAAVLTIATATPATALTPAERSEIEALIKDYLMRNPEVLRDALMELQRRADAEESKKRGEALKAYHDLIFKSPRGVVVGNKSGDVAVVEFFDYNCGYCKRALSDMMDMLKADPKLRFVLKEFPVLGQGSVEAARVSVAVRMQDADGGKYLEFHRRLLMTRGQVNGERARSVAKEVGVDMARLDKDLKSSEIDDTLAESLRIADAIGISGTPSYVIGDEVVAGAVGMAALKRKVDAVRKCGKATC